MKLELKNVKKSFDEKIVLENINLEINEGAIFGLVGINGAGKSTLLRCIGGVYAVDEGEILLNDEKIFENSKIKQNIFFLPDEPYSSMNVTATSIFNFYKSYYPNINRILFYDLLKKFEINPKSKILKFSKGMKRRLYIALAFAIKPKILLLDEAFDGLDPLARLELKNGLIELVEQNNMIIIISSHSLRELEDICDSFAILDNKQIKTTGSFEDEIDSYYKVQLAFDQKITKEDFANFNVISITITSKFATLVCKGNYEEDLEKFKKLNPKVIDRIELNFEDFFISLVNKENIIC